MMEDSETSPILPTGSDPVWEGHLMIYRDGGTEHLSVGDGL